MKQLLSLVFQVTIFYALHLCFCESTSIRLSPLGTVSVCPRGQALLTCERISGSFLYWNVSVPHLAVSRESIVANEGDFSSLQFSRLHSTAFTITRTSGNPLISQLLVNNVTTEINGSTIYCSENGNETGTPMATVNVTNKAHPLNVSLVNHFLTNGVTVTLQWYREAGATYNVNVLPLMALTNSTSHNMILLHLTIPYDSQYNVSIVSSVCGITTSRVLKYDTCDLPTKLLNRPVIVDTGSQDHPQLEGEIITYSCPPGLALNGSNASVCTGDGEWDPDPGELDCIADCRVPVVNRNVMLNYSSTLDSSVAILTCVHMSNVGSTDEQILNVTCHSNGSWIPDPAEFICLSSTTALPGFTTEASDSVNSSLIIILILSGIILIFSILLILYVIKRKCVAKKISDKDLRYQEPTYEEVTRHKEIQMEGNAAYGHVIH